MPVIYLRWQKKIKMMKAFGKMEDIGLIFQPPFEVLLAGGKCSDDYEALDEEEIKQLCAAIEA